MGMSLNPLFFLFFCFCFVANVVYPIEVDYIQRYKVSIQVSLVNKSCTLPV